MPAGPAEMARRLGDGVSRRSLFRVGGRAAAVAGAATLVAGCATSAEPAGASTPAAGAATPARTRAVLLGTGGGPVILTRDRAGVSTAVVYDGRVYVVDLGLGSHSALFAAGLGGPGPNAAFANVQGVFFTHMHSDHLAEWPSVLAIGPMNITSRAANSPPIHVFGPGSRQTLPRIFPPTRPQPALVAPAGPVPGITDTSARFRDAWAADFNDRMRDANFVDPHQVFRISDIDLSGLWTPDPQGVPPALDGPIPIWTDGDVRVTATLVNHHPMAPAFAFRFDTPDGSITISGDTRPSDNLIALARGTDVLVHEVIDPSFADLLASKLPPDQAGPVRSHLLEAHTTIEQVGAVAEAAGAKTLVLTHLIPSDNPVERWEAAAEGFSGRLIVGADLMSIPVGA